MSHSANYLHSHSALERTLKDKDIANKSHVLVDEKFRNIFADIEMEVKHTTINGVRYCKVPILMFVHKGGVFKNFDA